MPDQDVILRALEGLQKGMVAIMEDLGVLKQDVGVLKQDVAGLKQDVGVLKQDVGELKQDVGSLKQNLAGLRRDHDEFVEFVKENVVTKDEFARELIKVKTEIMTHVDGLAAHNQRFDQELLMMRNRQDRLEEQMAR